MFCFQVQGWVLIVIFVILCMLTAGIAILLNFFAKYMERVRISICNTIQDIMLGDGQEKKMGEGGKPPLDNILKMFASFNEVPPPQEPEKQPRQQVQINEIEEHVETPVQENPAQETPAPDSEDVINNISKMKYEELRELLKTKYGVSNAKGTKLELINKIKVFEELI